MAHIVQITFILLAVGTITYWSISLVRGAKKPFRKFNHRDSDTLSRERYRMLALGAVCGEQQSAYINSLATGVSLSKTRSMLHDYWGITDKLSATNVLDELVNNARHPVLPIVLSAYENNDEHLIHLTISNENQVEKAKKQLTSLIDTLSGIKSEDLDNTIASIERLGIDGWDLGCLVYITRMCYDAGLVSESTAWTYIARADELASSRYRSWEEFADSYTLGFALWRANNNLVFDDEPAKITQSLLSHPRSPWVQLHWD